METVTHGEMITQSPHESKYYSCLIISTYTSQVIAEDILMTFDDRVKLLGKYLFVQPTKWLRCFVIILIFLRNKPMASAIMQQSI